VEWKCELRQLDLSVDILSSLLVARISMRKPDFEPRVIYVGLVVEEVTLARLFCWLLLLSQPVSFNQSSIFIYKTTKLYNLST